MDGLNFKNRIIDIDKLQKEIDSHKPLKKEALKQLKEYYRIGLTYSSNAIEGNSLTETETKIVLEQGITISGKPLKDHYEAIGHSEAFDYLYKLVQKDTIAEADLLKLHRLFYDRIDRKNAGKYRKIGVFIQGSDIKLPPPSRLKSLVQELINKIPELQKKYHPVEFAAILHKELVSIHPFIDGNGRISRLLMNLALLQKGYEIVAIPPILRDEYIRSLRVCDKRDDIAFINLITSLEYESQKEYLRLLETLSEK
ncbi:Fic family protein [Candidatus Poribacteria bacterium]|nr:Fic family protein [Candidatus Poribacteria bacterium]